MEDRLKAVKAAYRLDHLSDIRGQIEQTSYEIVASASSEDPQQRAEWYIKLARAVFPVSREDAVAYFDYAIEAVSKFGDEIVERWEAVASLANQSVDSGIVSPELAYRFIRCAELIGDNVDREKYFNRNGAIRTLAKLSPVSAMAALSRWRDREVGWFQEQLPVLAEEMVYSKYLSPLVGWSLTAFYEGYRLDDFASLCMDRESSTFGRKYILEKAIRQLRLNEATENSWQKLKGVAELLSVRSRELDDILTFYTENTEKERREKQPQMSLINDSENENVNLDEVFQGLELTSSVGISQAIQRFNITKRHQFLSSQVFWQEVFRHIDEGDVSKFLRALISAESADLFDIQIALSSMPEEWRHKASVKRNWSNVLEAIARRFAQQFTNHGTFEYFVKDIKVEIDDISHINKGIIEGLSSNSDLVDSSTFFGFVVTASHLVTQQQATDLLEYALARFELHIDKDYADGEWSNWLLPPDDVSMVFAGFVWSALGSPRTKTRWQAAHCVRRLAEANCQAEIDSLVKWMEHDRVDAFGSSKFPFYNLHARLYLLIALARVSIEMPQILKNHCSIFYSYALGSTPHVLIQKFSSEIALNLEMAFPGAYSQGEIEELHKVGVSQLPRTEMDDYEEIESIWHQNGEVDKSLEFYHGMDFESYWFEPLAEVFGITSEQVAEMATQVVIKEWCIESDRLDPRKDLWRSHRNESETWHSHGDYPRSDSYNFYLSYHAMFVVAAKLLEGMPIVNRRDWSEDEWGDWLSNHTLTRNDGRWLSDRRDPAPLLQPIWNQHEKTADWLTVITADDFRDGVLFEHKGDTWLNVYGSWTEGDGERIESFTVSSALVSVMASQSLLNALTTCSNPYDFKLPDYCEERMEFDSAPFVLKGWVWRNDSARNLDEKDPHAAEVAFPPYHIGASIIERLNLSVDLEQREWFLPNSNKTSIICNIWSTNKSDRDEEPTRHGNRLSASLDFLKKMCAEMECDLIIEAQIHRRVKYRYYSRSDDESGYKPPLNKIYILSADGKLRDAETYYEFRESSGERT